MKKEKAYILGALCGDGCLYIKKHYYRIEFINCSERLAKIFERCIKKVYNLKCRRYILITEGKKPSIRVRCNNKKAALDINSYGKFGKYDWRIPKVISCGNKIIKSAFLKGFYDSEGTVNKTSNYICLYSCNHKGIMDIASLLRSLGIYSSIRKRTKFSKNSYAILPQYKLYITYLDGMRKFANFINFSVEIKRNKLLKIINRKLKRVPHNYNEYIKVLNLKKQGYDIKTITDKTNLPKSTVYFWVNNLTKPRIFSKMELK